MLILDTNVLSETMQPAPSAHVMEWWAGQEPAEIFTTSVTIAEIFYGIAIMPHGKRRTALQEGADRMFGRVFFGHILSFDEAAAREFAEIAAKRRVLGRPIAEFDAQIAAIVSVHRATLATRNTADSDGCGVPLVNPWRDSSS